MYRQLLSIAMVLICNTALYAVDLVGNVTDENDEPLAGVRVDVLNVVPTSRIKNIVLFDTFHRLYESSRHPECKKFAKTDKAGKFIIPNVDPDLSYWLAASIADKQISFAPYAPKGKDRITIKMKAYPDIDEDHWLKGKVVDRNDAPVPYAFVKSEYFQDGKEPFSPGLVEHGYAVTDDEGLFQIPIKHDPKNISITVAADGYSEVKVYSENPSDPLPPIKIPNGTRLTGKLVADGMPAANQKVAVVQVDQSIDTVIGKVHHTDFFHGLQPRAAFDLYTNPNFISAVTATTDSEGIFYFETLPEDQHYAIYTPYEPTGSKWAVRTSYFKAKGNDQTFDLGVIPLVQTVTLAGKVVMAEGETLTRETLLLKHSPAFNSIKVPLNSKGEFRVENLSPETYQISIHGFDSIIDETKMAQHIISGREFAIHLSKDRHDVVIPLRKLREEEVVVPKENRTSPDLQSSLESSIEDNFEQALTGIVVNPMENPLGGISVSAIPLNFEKFMPKVFLPGGSEISTRSCPEGRFVLDALSDQLMVLEVKSPAAERARFGDSKTPMFPHAVGERRVEKNQKDIRIIFDPEVFTKIPEIK